MSPRLLAALLPLILSLACQEYAEPSLTPGQKKKVEAHLLKEAPKPQTPVGAIIEGQVKLIGYDVDKTTVRDGDTVSVTWYLEALADKMGDNKIFVHFQGQRGDREAWMNLDHHPVEGLLPLRQLQKGQIVKDIQTFTVKKGFTPGPARLYFGLFRGDHRLKIDNDKEVPHDAEGRIQGPLIEVQGDPKAPKRAPLPTANAEHLKADETITVDGTLDEPVWQRCRETDRFIAPDGSGRSSPHTRARFAWDDKNLYVAVVALDDDIWSTFTERDSNTWEQEVIEMFIDADGDQKDYLELQVTPANVVFDARFPTYRSDLAAARAWNMEGWQTAVKVTGTLNQRDDVDEKYTLELIGVMD